MPGKLRIFISSTMEDLENERALIVKQLASMNFEPVNAEGFLPDGTTSWDRISEELETCHVFVLLSGIRYGWIPTSGPLSTENISVTHGEYRAAQELGLPILPFFKNLSYRTDRDSDEAKRRDAFRNEVAGWDQGQFRSMFNNVVDLADMVGAAVVRMLADNFQRAQIAKRRAQSPNPPVPPPIPVRPAAAPPGTAAGLVTMQPPAQLVHATAEGRATLWVGSGMSLRAGMPSSALLTAELVQSMQESAVGYTPPAVGSGIASVASDFELLQGRASLLDKLRRILDLPGGVGPSEVHLQAVRLFPRIITTNYDRLLETAAERARTGHALVVGPQLPTPAPEKFIWKIHGSPDYPDLLVMSEGDLARFEDASAVLYAALKGIFKSGPVLVAGTSLRDPSVLRLFRHFRPILEGYWTVMEGDVLGQARARELHLEPLACTLETILAALSQSKNEA